MCSFGFLKPDVKKMKENKDIDGLIKSLNYTDKNVRKEAVKALGKIGDSKAVKPLLIFIMGLRSPSWRNFGHTTEDGHYSPGGTRIIDDDRLLREAAFEALEKLDPPSDTIGQIWYSIAKLGWEKAASLENISADPLIALLNVEDVGARAHAAKAFVLSKIGDDRAVEPLITSLREAARTLEGIPYGFMEGEPFMKLLVNSIGALIVIRDHRAVEPLIELLKHSRSDVREAAIEALAGIRNSIAVEPLIETLKHSDKFSRAHAAKALGKIGDSRAVEPLINVLKDEWSYNAHEAVIEALGNIVDQKAVEPLIGALANRNSHVRSQAVKALGQIRDSRAIKPLTTMLNDEDVVVRQKATEALKRITTAGNI